MGKQTGFLEWHRAHLPRREQAERLLDFHEVALPLLPAEATEQAGRCMDCGIPVCHQGCPLGNVIPDFNDHVFHGRWREAYLCLASTNDFPEFTGRLCPAPCEAACVLSINDGAVTIEEMEKEIIERAFAEGWVVPRPPSRRTDRKVAVVGSGPAGLAAAAALNRAGHRVTVFEQADKLGGLLRYGIPDFKLEKGVIDRRLAILEAEGIELRTGADVGGAIPWRRLRADHDAVLLACGARRARELALAGRELPGVVQAMDYLEEQNRAVAGEPLPARRLHASGKRVVILGGGDTGSDCLGTALRQRASHVTQLELLPAPPRERTPENPWPQWPMVFRTSSSQEEGGERSFGLRTVRLSARDGRLAALHAVPVKLTTGADGRTTLADTGGPEVTIEVELLILALGFTGPELGAVRSELGVELDARGNVRVDARFATTAPGVFAAGDASRGASLIVWAISDGREAARAIDTQLTGKPSALPTRGQNRPFGGR